MRFLESSKTTSAAERKGNPRTFLWYCENTCLPDPVIQVDPGKVTEIPSKTNTRSGAVAGDCPFAALSISLTTELSITDMPLFPVSMCQVVPEVSILMLPTWMLVTECSRFDPTAKDAEGASAYRSLEGLNVTWLPPAGRRWKSTEEAPNCCRKSDWYPTPTLDQTRSVAGAVRTSAPKRRSCTVLSPEALLKVTSASAMV